MLGDGPAVLTPPPLGLYFYLIASRSPPGRYLLRCDPLPQHPRPAFLSQIVNGVCPQTVPYISGLALLGDPAPQHPRPSFHNKSSTLVTFRYLFMSLGPRWVPFVFYLAPWPCFLRSFAGLERPRDPGMSKRVGSWAPGAKLHTFGSTHWDTFWIQKLKKHKQVVSRERSKKHTTNVGI